MLSKIQKEEDIKRFDRELDAPAIKRRSKPRHLSIKTRAPLAIEAAPIPALPAPSQEGTDFMAFLGAAQSGQVGR